LVFFEPNVTIKCLWYIGGQKLPWYAAIGSPHGSLGVGWIYHGMCELNMESMTPHGTFSLESFILNFQILAPKC